MPPLPAILADNPDGYWPLDDGGNPSTALDYGRVKSNGTLTNTPVFASKGVPSGGNAPRFNKANNTYIEIADNASFDNGNTGIFVVEALIHPITYTTTAGYFFTKQFNSWTFFMNSTTFSWTTTQSDGTANAALNPSIALPLNTWTHVAGYYDKSNSLGYRLAIFLNGVRVSETTTMSVVMGDTNTSVRIGSCIPGLSTVRGFDGYIAHCAIFRTNPITPAAIGRHAKACLDRPGVSSAVIQRRGRR